MADSIFQVISDFYELKNLVLGSITIDVARKFDICFGKFREALDKPGAQINNDGSSTPENKELSEKMKLFEKIRQESIDKLSVLFDAKLTEILEQFFKQSDVATKIKHLVNAQTQETLIYPTYEANQEIGKIFKDDLENLHKEISESLKQKESHLSSLNETLKELPTKCKSDQVILLKVSLFSLKFITL